MYAFFNCQMLIFVILGIFCSCYLFCCFHIIYVFVSLSLCLFCHFCLFSCPDNKSDQKRLPCFHFCINFKPHWQMGSFPVIRWRWLRNLSWECTQETGTKEQNLCCIFFLMEKAKEKKSWSLIRPHNMKSKISQSQPSMKMFHPICFELLLIIISSKRASTWAIIWKVKLLNPSHP